MKSPRNTFGLAQFDPRIPPWLDGVPTHWRRLPNRAIFRERIERGFGQEQMLTVTISDGIRRQDEFLAASSKKDSSNEDRSKYKLVLPGDIAYNKMRMWQGAVGLSEYRGLVSPAYIILTPQLPINPRFYHYLFRSPLYTTASYRWSYGICDDMLSLRYEDFKQIHSPLPPIEEQDAIVAFLDRKLAEIDRFITNKRHMIALLREQRASLLDNIVTGRSIDEETRAVDSPYLPSIPMSWRVVRLRHLVQRIDQGDSPLCENFLADKDSWGVLKAGCVNSGVFRETEHKRLPPGTPIAERNVVREGDVLMSRASGSPRFVGSVARVGPLGYRLLLCDKTFRLCFANPRIIEFVVYAMNAPYFRRQVETSISGAEGLANNLPLSAIKSFILAVPPEGPAIELAADVKCILGRISSSIARIEAEIDLINEFRFSIIAETVTGKIDVRSKP